MVAPGRWLKDTGCETRDLLALAMDKNTERKSGDSTLTGFSLFHNLVNGALLPALLIIDMHCFKSTKK
jgi:hypothetical protein